MGVSAGDVGPGAIQRENPPGSQHGLFQRPEGSAADRWQEGEADPWLEGDQRSFHKGGRTKVSQYNSLSSAQIDISRSFVLFYSWKIW